MVLELVLAQAFWFFFPAYVTHPIAVLAGGGRPMDGGRLHRDGRRLLGDGKTRRGFVGGVLFGIGVGVLMWAGAEAYDPRFSFGPVPWGLVPIVALAVSSMLGDLLGSYAKRRMGVERGARSPWLDPFAFLLVSFLALALADFPLFFERYVGGEAVFGLLFIIVITPVLHRAMNILGHKLGKKEVPW